MVSHWSISVKAAQQLREEIFKSAIKPSIRSYTEALNYGRKQLRKNPNFARPFFGEHLRSMSLFQQLSQNNSDLCMKFVNYHQK